MSSDSTPRRSTQEQLRLTFLSCRRSDARWKLFDAGMEVGALLYFICIVPWCSSIDIVSPLGDSPDVSSVRLIVLVKQIACDPIRPEPAC